MLGRVVLAAASLAMIGACASPEPARIGTPSLVSDRAQPILPPCGHGRSSAARERPDRRCTVKTAWWDSMGEALEGAAMAVRFRQP